MSEFINVNGVEILEYQINTVHVGMCLAAN